MKGKKIGKKYVKIRKISKIAKLMKYFNRRQIEEQKYIYKKLLKLFFASLLDGVDMVINF